MTTDLNDRGHPSIDLSEMSALTLKSDEAFIDPSKSSYISLYG